MRYLPNGDQMRRADQYTIDEKEIPSEVLMERAARSCVEYIIRNGEDTESICVVCGSGNNGGDGFAIARFLSELDMNVHVLFAGDETKLTEEAGKQYALLKETSVCICENINQKAYTLVIDALFGVGLSREITGKYKTLIDRMNKAQGKKLAVDIPSGISADTGNVLGTAFRADCTITFQCVKFGMSIYPGKAYAGEVIVSDIGISTEVFKNMEDVATEYSPAEYRAMLPPRKQNSHKGTYGRLLCISGSEGMAGAAYLNGLAAYRSGAGLVKILTSHRNIPILQMLLPEAIVYDCDTMDVDSLRKHIQWADAICIGSGLGTGERARLLLKEVLNYAQVPIIIDADGINILSQEPLTIPGDHSRLILTPHMKEFSALIQKDIAEIKKDRVGYMKELFVRFGGTLVLKDARTVIYSPGSKFCVNTSGNSALAKAGSGDVLAGIISGFVVQGAAPCEAAAAGTYIHGRAAQYCAEKNSEYSVMSSEIANAIGQVISSMTSNEKK